MFGTYIYPTGLRYIYTSLACSVIGFIFGFHVFMELFLALALFLVWFFRNPTRTTLIEKKGDIISPADGVVIKIIDDAVAPVGYEDINQKWKQVSIFMRVSDVHVNRAPISGVIRKVMFTPGQFKYAAAAQADTDNERLSILIEGDFKVICQQVAGMLARRILCNVTEGEKVAAGDLYGFIQLGSRADIWFPADLNVCVKKGDKVKAGLNYIARA